MLENAAQTLKVVGRTYRTRGCRLSTRLRGQFLLFSPIELNPSLTLDNVQCFIVREWWNPSSKQGAGPLHSMNVTRVQYIAR